MSLTSYGSQYVPSLMKESIHSKHPKKCPSNLGPNTKGLSELHSLLKGTPNFPYAHKTPSTFLKNMMQKNFPLPKLSSSISHLILEIPGLLTHHRVLRLSAYSQEHSYLPPLSKEASLIFCLIVVSQNFICPRRYGNFHICPRSSRTNIFHLMISVICSLWVRFLT